MATSPHSQRVPLHDAEAEAAALGCMLLSPEAAADLAQWLEPEDFHVKAHRIVFEATRALVEEGKPVDLRLLADALSRGGRLDEAGGGELLADLMEAVPSAAGARHYAEIVTNLSRLRRLAQACTETLDEVYRRADEPDRLVDRAEQRVLSVRRQESREGARSVKDLMMETILRVENRQGQSGLSGLDTGFLDLNDKLDGLQPGSLVVVAARPSMGKTTFALNIASRAALKTGKTVLIFSVEMPREQVAENLLALTARVDAHKMRKGQLDPDEDWPRLLDAANALQETNILIDDTPSLSTMALRAKARRVQRRHGLGLIVVDYLQLMTHAKAESRQHEITMISQTLKHTARELGVPVLALSQLNRAVDSREDHRPRMSDLRESGSIEQDADVILFLYRPAYYNPNLPPDERPVVEVICAKHRNGPTGTIRLHFFENVLRFEDPARAP